MPTGSGCFDGGKHERSRFEFVVPDSIGFLTRESQKMSRPLNTKGLLNMQ